MQKKICVLLIICGTNYLNKNNPSTFNAFGILIRKYLLAYRAPRRLSGAPEQILQAHEALLLLNFILDMLQPVVVDHILSKFHVFLSNFGEFDGRNTPA